MRWLIPLGHMDAMFQDLELSVMRWFAQLVGELDHLRLNRSSHEYKRIKCVVSLMPPYALHCVHIRRTLRRLRRKE